MNNCENWNVYLTFQFLVFEDLYLCFIFVQLLNKGYYVRCLCFYPNLNLIL